MSQKKQKLDAYLAEVFKQFIAIKDDDLKRAQEVFKNVFAQIKEKMGEQCNYFQNYSKQVMYAGSVYDGIKVTNMDEFDMDIVVKLPINYDDIILENDQPGFLKLKITTAFDNLDKQQHWELRHKVTRDWRDADKYLLQNKFRHWLHAIVSRALNEMRNQVDVNGTVYQVTYRETGPAFTLLIRNNVGDEEFSLDVDLVPVIRFQHPRWPKDYKMIETGGDQKQQTVRDWLVVPKPNKAIQDGALKNRCWRLSFQDFEREMMKGNESLKTTIRLVKKLRDGLGHKSIASYYIKTLFLWQIDQTKDKSYWTNKISFLFREMVEKLYLAIKHKKIMYFWHPDNNLIEGVKPTVLRTYEVKLKEVLDTIDANDCEKVVSYFLSSKEMAEFKSSEFYVRVSAQSLSKQMSVASENSQTGSQSSDRSSTSQTSEAMRGLNDELDSLRGFVREDKVEQFERRLADMEDRVTRLEMAMKKLKLDKELAELFEGVSLNGVKASFNGPVVDDAEPLLKL